ncbi:MAG: type VI secretion system baseplate subunit TssE [Nitrospinota bacterium]
MTDQLYEENLAPSLLDRLTDDAPDEKQEARAKRAFSVKQLKDSVHRDLVWLLNSGSLDDLTDFSETPHAEKSVINFGLPELAGVTASTIDTFGLNKKLKEIIKNFEPRIISNSVKVMVNKAKEKMSSNTLTIKIEGKLKASPLPLHLLVKTELDLESGDMSITDFVAET